MMVKLFAAVLSLSLVSSATEFGKNKVQYENFNWHYLKATHFSLYYHQNQGSLPDTAFRWIDRIYDNISRRFSFIHKDPVPIVLYASPNYFEQTNIITELIPEEVGGFTELFKNRVVIPYDGSKANLYHVLNHELVHAFIFGILYEQLGGGLLMNSGVQVPLWFNEGLAEYLSQGWDIEADMFLMDMVINGTVPVPGPELGGYMAYKGGESFLYYLSSAKGDSAFTKFLREFKQSKSVDAATKRIYNADLEQLGQEWIQELRRIYWPEIGRRMDPRKNARAVTSHLDTRDHYNLRPRISPDGTRIAYYSDRYDYTRILICDRKGKVLQTISQNGSSGFFESFHPFRSGMCWSPDGKRLAFVTKSSGNDELRISDLSGGKFMVRIPTDLSSISSPDWSHNGKYLAFSGIHKGKNDLFIYDLDNHKFKKLTDDYFCESDPHFSPDDKGIVFAVDDTAVKPSKGRLTPYGTTPANLAYIALDSLNVKVLTHTPWNEKYPCYSPDGKHIAFISDRNGIANLYIAPTDTPDQALPVTDFVGGCMHPDWAKDGSIVFGMFQKQGWDIWLMEKPLTKLIKKPLAQTRWINAMTDSAVKFFSPPILPPDSTKPKVTAKAKGKETKDGKIIKSTESSESFIMELDSSKTIPSDSSLAGKKTPASDSLKQVTGDTANTTVVSSIDITGSPKTDTADAKRNIPLSTVPADSAVAVTADTKEDTAIKTTALSLPSPRPYTLKFTPDMMALGVGVSTYYGYAGQWLMSLSDIMGDHRITLAGDIQGRFDEYIHLYASYIYLKYRLDMGAGAFYSKDYTYADIFGDSLYHDTEYGGFLMAQYPFSLSSRLDFQVYGRQQLRDPVHFDGSQTKSTVLLPSVSYVYDNILWGITGPLNGMRGSVSLMASPPLSFIDKSFVSMNGDFRMYTHFLNRFVWANRIFAGASTGLDKNSSARRYFLGGEDNWLFYGVNVSQWEKNIQNTFYSDFVTPFRGWKYMDLTGTRAAVFNTEFRFPFIRDISVAWPLPMEIRYINGALFADVGNAWDKEDQIEGLPFPNKLYGGFGFGMRANLGIFVLRYDRGWPTDWRVVGTPINYFSLGAEF